ncbi:helix-turn-helix domain-containing protein [Nannocystis punicea]|uniref:Helix-turn-helix domain-containing protein n=1 Tax=Nannocystis punicea TaxID=2995304 RepID=A0ABY7GY91_9BACT|nr:helix-turn-helix domain-containing protein [Nannocystis poenicansa]WAS91921.1 helix-turn-helix domain-containing protein [Nannocystis poenicansa]
MFTGNAIRELREKLGMTPEQFAGLLGVHPSSLYRWEAKHDDVVRLDPMQLRILTALRDELNRKQHPREQAEWGQVLLTALLIGGGLFALFKLLEAVFDDGSSARSSARASSRGGAGTRS